MSSKNFGVIRWLKREPANMSSHSDSELGASQHKLINQPRFKARDKAPTNYLSAIKRRIPEAQQQKLLRAVSLNNVESVQEQLESGADPNSSDKIGRSALHLAASRGYTEMVKILLEYGANPNTQDIIQNTPLHLAACNSNLHIITVLINGGADLRSLDMHGRNPLQLAKSKLDLLRRSWKSGAVEMMQIRKQVQEIVDIMISLWKHKESTMWGHHRSNVDDLELMKLSLSSDPEEQVDDQMGKLLDELQQFSIK